MMFLWINLRLTAYYSQRRESAKLLMWDSEGYGYQSDGALLFLSVPAGPFNQTFCLLWTHIKTSFCLQVHSWHKQRISLPASTPTLQEAV